MDERIRKWEKMEQIFEKNETGKGKKKKPNRKVEFVLQYSDFMKVQ